MDDEVEQDGLPKEEAALFGADTLAGQYPSPLDDDFGNETGDLIPDIGSLF